ncbi:MAG: hypothetical protein CMF62_04260 [Magnetococcales bacterium]|nr:hypothetical protein [Magnetococcales bacterium]
MDIYTLFRTCKNKDKLLEVLKQKPNLNIKNYNSGITLSMFVFRYCDDKDILLEVLKQKPGFNIQDIYGYTIAMYAFLCCKDKDVLLELLRQKPDLTLKNRYNTTALDYALEYYVKSPNFKFDVLEKLYDENCKQDKQLFNPKYIKLRNKYKVLPLILFRHYQRYSTKN